MTGGANVAVVGMGYRGLLEVEVAAITALGFELRRTDPKVSTVQKWTRALEAAGIQFISDDATGGVGVRLRPGVKVTTSSRTRGAKGVKGKEGKRR